MEETLFEELKRYVRFAADDEAALRALHPIAKPHFQRISEVFYNRILDHPEARHVLEAGESQVGRLKVTLVAWMEGLLLGPWDEVYFEKRARIGRVHVRIGLPQHYMFGAMNVMRRELKGIVESSSVMTPARMAVDKILDLELAIMLHTYREDLIAEKLAAVGTLTAGLSHEIRNPLNSAGLQLAVLERRIEHLGAELRPQLHEPLRLAHSEIRRLEHILQDFLQFARPVKLTRAAISLEPLLTRVLDLLEVEAEQRAVRIIRRCSPISAMADADRLHQVILNLCLNAIEAMISGGRLTVSTALEEREAVITIDDTGPGIPEEAQNRLFEPFFTTKPTGSGLGLSIAHAIIQQHEGLIAVRNLETGGARFEVRLPAA